MRKNIFIFILLFLFVIILFFTLLQNSLHTGGNIKKGRIVQLSHNGAWVWHTDPSTLWHNGRLFFSYVDISHKKNMISSYDPFTHKIYPIEVSTKDSSVKDSHDHPSLLSLPDNRLFLSYNRHGADTGFFFRHSRVHLPESLSDLSDEKFNHYDTTNFTCYSNSYYLATEGKLYNFTRWLDNKPTLSISHDSGESWSSPTKLLTNHARRPYVHYGSNGKDRIDMIYTDGHPRLEKNSLYHSYYSHNNLHKSDGTVMSSLQTLPLNNDIPSEQGTIIYKYSEKSWSTGEGIDNWIPFGRAWVWDIEYTKAGLPVVVFSVSPQTGAPFSDKRIYYYYAWLTPDNIWKKKMIAHAGSPLYKAEEDFAGGITLDPNNPSIIYYSSNSLFPSSNTSKHFQSPLSLNNEYKLYKGIFDREKNSISSELFIEKKGKILIRPFVPSGNNSSIQSVLWMEGEEYINMKQYSTSIMGWISQ